MKNILIGISGGIAAYKSAELVRCLVQQGLNVKVCMTKAAMQFITPLTLQALSGNPVHTELLNTRAEAGMGHIELAKWADCIMIAPATANFIAHLSHGLANDLLSTLCLATKAPIIVAPAMNQQMWKNQATQHNINRLQQRQIQIAGPASGEQACGDVGLGRLLEASELADIVLELTKIKPVFNKLFKKTNILITAGPTREAIDPVRFITNRSSGKMGYAIAIAAQKMGANVTLISGIVNLKPPQNIKTIVVENAQQMYETTLAVAPIADIFIATAAVADYRVENISSKKIKKSHQKIQLNLIRNPDILATVSTKFPDIFSVGFAAETNHLIQYARRKLQQKKINMIAANHVGKNLGFEQNDNALEVLWSDGQMSLPKMDKQQLAQKLLMLVAKKF